MVLTEKRPMRYALLGTGAILTGLTLVFPTVGFLEWLTMIPLGLFLLEVASDATVGMRKLWGFGVFYFFCFGLVTFHWFINLYPLEFVDGMSKGGALAVVLVAWLGLPLLQALFGGFVFVLAGLCFRSTAAKKLPFLKPFLGAGLWAVYEWTQTLGWWGVPWGRLPLGQTKYLVGLQTASWFGSYFVTFLLVAVNFCLAYALLAYWRREETYQKEIRRACLAAAILLVFQYGAGSALWFANPVGKSDRTLTAAGVQGNISSAEKWGSSSSLRTREVYREKTLAAAEAGASVVLWPETALPFTVEEGNVFYAYASSLAREAEVTILVGAFTDKTVDGEYLSYNSLICFLPDGSMHDTVYFKRHLVPFGEYVPMQRLIETLVPPLADLVLSGANIVAGEEAAVLSQEEGKIGSLICFDSIYEELTRDSVREGAEVLFLATNDSWFTDSVALDMHNAQAQLRAVESGRYVLRAANTGLSTIITHRGEIAQRIPPHEAGIVSGQMELRTQNTLYSYIGNAFVYLLILIFANVIGYDVGRRIREKYEKIMKKM